jgi:nucleotide-binding universal stress UspA family protein
MSSRQIRTILVGIDLPGEDAPGVDPVLATAATLAQGLRADLHVVHAVESGPLEPPLPPSLSREMETAAAALDRYLDEVLPKGVTTAGRQVSLGRAHRVLAERASTVGADLLVLGPHRGGNLHAQVLGTTADRVLRTVDVPCWVVRGSLSLPLRRLAAPVDFSKVSERSLDMALLLAHSLGGAAGARGAPPPELDVLYVEWPVTLEDDPDLVERELLPRLGEAVDQARARMSLGAAATIRPSVRGAVDPSRGILAHADESDSDLLVLGTHGRGAVARALLGDVASIVTRNAHCHVVLVPPVPGTDGR